MHIWSAVHGNLRILDILKCGIDTRYFADILKLAYYKFLYAYTLSVENQQYYSFIALVNKY